MVLLGGAVYVLSIIVEAYNNLQDYTAHGGTCSATAMLPLAIVGLVLWRNKYKT